MKCYRSILFSLLALSLLLFSCSTLKKLKTSTQIKVDSTSSKQVDTASLHLFDSVSKKESNSTNENTITVEFDSGFIVHEKINPNDFFVDSAKNISLIDVLSNFSGKIKKVTINSKITDTQKDIFQLKTFDSSGKKTNEDVQLKKNETNKSKTVERSGMAWYVWVIGGLLGLALLVFLLLRLYGYLKKRYPLLFNNIP